MRAVYLSHLKTLLPETTHSAEEYRSWAESQRETMEAEHPLYWLFQENGEPIDLLVTFEKTEGSQERLRTVKLPIFHAKNSEVAVELVTSEELRSQTIDYLIYCHETIEASHSMMPALRMKHHLGIKHCLPFSVCQTGSLSFPHAIEFAMSLLQEDTRKILITILDRMEAPFSRIHFADYLKGDAGTYLVLSNEPGDYLVLDSRICAGCLSKPMQEWTTEDYRFGTEQIVKRAGSLLDESTAQHPIDHVIVQQVSEVWIEQVEQMVLEQGRRVSHRENWRDVNLLGSDPFVTLEEIERNRMVEKGQVLLLLFASIDHGVGAVVIRKEKDA